MFDDLSEHLEELTPPSVWDLTEARAFRRVLQKREYQRHRLQTDPEYRQRHREYNRANKAKKRKNDPNAPCPECHGPKLKARKFCTDRCRERNHAREHSRARRQRLGTAKPASTPCPHCGAAVPQSQNVGRPRRFCNSSCAYYARKAARAN